MNSGSFEQTTTSWLIEKTEGLINWKFTHIAQRSQGESAMFKYLGKTMMMALAGTSISIGSAMAKTTPNPVYQVVDDVKAESAEMCKAQL